ncbi:hypothetical protein [Spirosoma luteum]|uniref:hypothetical protein n=1 Tax=Spirosoma luteum TaxID=431553 RepID=UPI0012FB7AFE|nr:hypothetical protein [Spirosoma luteum]
MKNPVPLNALVILHSSFPDWCIMTGYTFSLSGAFSYLFGYLFFLIYPAWTSVQAGWQTGPSSAFIGNKTANNPVFA